MDELNQFAANIADLYNTGSGELDLPTAREIVKEIKFYITHILCQIKFTILTP